MAFPTKEFPHTTRAALEQFIFKSMSQPVFKSQASLDNFMREVARLGTREIMSGMRLDDNAWYGCPLPKIPVLEAQLLSRNQRQLHVWTIPGLLRKAVLCVITKGSD